MAQAGQRVGEYILDQQVGRGTFGEVWRAHHHVWLDQLVAMKIPTDVQYVRNLQREGAAIHGLMHPNIVRAMGFDPYCDPPYLTMEYVPGTSLRTLIKERKFASHQDAISVMKQVLAGLAYAHERGVVHRDVKPENVLIHERAFAEGYEVEGVVKVTDFGLGKAANSTAVGSIALSASLNDAHGRELAGTLEYMSPEQRAGDAVDLRSDLYACGVMLYEMLTGEKPAGTEVPSDLNRSVPKYLDEVFRRSYARLEKRFVSAEEFATALGKGGPPPLPRPVAQTGGKCPRCQTPVENGDQFCTQCGVQLVANVRRCGRCGAYPDVDDEYCVFCGEDLKRQDSGPSIRLART
jgi:serine/threonine protein kinase